jgi:murein DD-endopeptidase MepM/ murein hydrolase activator NlpD
MKMKNIKIKVKRLFKAGRFKFWSPPLILIISLLTTFAQCPTIIPPEGNMVKPDGSATLELQGVATVNFPPGSFSLDQKLDIAQTSDPDTEALFDEFAILYKVISRFSYEVRINTGIEPPATENFELSLKIPDDFLSSVPDGYGIELFVQVYSKTEMETLDNFILVPSNYDPSMQTLSSELNSSFFTNERLSDRTYEIIITVAATPGANISSSGVSNIARKFQIDEIFSGEQRCKAGSIICPLLSGCETVNSPYGWRDVDNDGKEEFHWGVDFDAPVGKAILAVADGTIKRVWVQKAKPGEPSYGLYIIIEHEDGSSTLYGHLKSTHYKIQDDLNKKLNIPVKKGHAIGLSGGEEGHPHSGSSTGPHLHLDYVPNGWIIGSKERIDPFACINASNDINSSILIRDNGSLQDDAFKAYLDDFPIGITNPGGSKNMAINNIRPGNHELEIVCIEAPDNVGTLEIILNDGIIFLDGSTQKSLVLGEGQKVTYIIDVPN